MSERPEEKAETEAAKLKALRRAVQLGIDDIERGEYTEHADADALVAYLKERCEADLGSV